MSLDKDHSFELLEELGGGGFATAYKTRIINPKVLSKWKCEEIVVIKLPNDEDSSIDLSNEIDLNSALKNGCTNREMEYLCKVYGVSAFNSNFGPKLVMIMEFMPEGNLRKRIQHNILDTEKTVSYIKDILHGLCVIHRNRIVHRDIKPENILFKNNRPKIADLGIGKSLRSRDYASTMTGTLYYMSPELLMGKEGATFNTDIWSLGIMLHEMLFGCLPFGMQYNHAQGQIITAILNTDDLLSPERKDVPDELTAILKKSLHKDHRKRYQTALEMLAEIEKFECGNIKENPDFKEYQIKRKNKEIDAAISMLENLIKRFPQCPDLYIELGCYYQSLARTRKALEIIDRGIEELPNCGNLYYEAAIFLNQLDEKEKAVTYLQNSISLGFSDNKNLIVAKKLIKNLTETK